MESNKDNGARNRHEHKIFKALLELSPALPFEFGSKTPPLPRILARALCEPNTTQVDDKDTTNEKDGTPQIKPEVAQDGGENVTRGEDGNSEQTESLSE